MARENKLSPMDLLVALQTDCQIEKAVDHYCELKRTFLMWKSEIKKKRDQFSFRRAFLEAFTYTRFQIALVTSLRVYGLILDFSSDFLTDLIFK